MKNKRLFNDNWSFYKTEVDAPYSKAQEAFDKFSPVDLPHDWLIYNTNDLYEDGTGWYKRVIVADEKMVKGTCIIRFEGVYMDTTVYLNDEKIMEWKYGYSTFDADLSGKLNEGENVLIVRVNHKSPNTRWYSGAGIFRDVWMYTTGTEYLPLDGTYIHTSKSGDGFDLEIETEVAASDGKLVHYAMALREATPVKDVDATLVDGKTAIAKKIAGPAGDKFDLADAVVKNGKASLSMHVDNPAVWDLENPNLYELTVSLDGGADEDVITMGFKDAVFTTDKGFFLNGKHVKLHGVCEHHDLGALGAAFNKSAMRRKFVTLKSMGVNAIRTSHNMVAVPVMELADEEGMLIVNEAFDMWENKKTDFDYHRFFKEWVDKDVASWVRRDRNHVSNIMWSIGNEIYDTHASEHGQEITKRLLTDVRISDPKENCPVTIGSNYMQWEGAQKCADIVKYAGYNYGERLYKEHREKYKDWYMYGSETSSIVQSRGIYHFPREAGCLSEVDEQCSCLGNSVTSWGAKSHNICIANDRDHEFMAGMFIWTGFDYIGEPTPYQTKNSYFGQIDTAGFPKDTYYIYKSEWVDAKEDPFVHLYPYWCFNEGQMVDVSATTNGASVELFVNGVSKGRHEIDHTQGDDQQGIWKVPYEKGCIEAVSYDESGAEIARMKRCSFGDAAKVILDVDRTTIKATGEDISYVSISVVDSDGNPVENATNYCDVKVEGAGRLVGCDNGDSADFDQYKSGHRRLFSGKLVALVASRKEAGEIKVTVTSEGLESATAVIKTVAAQCREGSATSYEIGMASDGAAAGNANGATSTDAKAKRVVPVRDIRLSAETYEFTADKKEIEVTATILPANATDTEVSFETVNYMGVKINFAEVKEVTQNGNIIKAKIVAYGDGEFMFRALSKSDTAKVKVISILEFKANGIGTAFLNPYEYLSAGLFSERFGKSTVGLEKGISLEEGVRNGAIYNLVDFGDYGTDEFTIDVFAFDDGPYPIELWLGEPEKGELLGTYGYDIPSIWNVFQPMTVALPRRIKGVQTISVTSTRGMHIRGFSFKYYEKAFSKVDAAECDILYGDKFEKTETSVNDIGNNVNVGFTNMHFGEDGAKSVTIWGRTPLDKNTIHIQITRADDSTERRIVEFPGGVAEFTANIETLTGDGTIEFIFLPGTQFDFDGFRFNK